MPRLAVPRISHGFQPEDWRGALGAWSLAWLPYLSITIASPDLSVNQFCDNNQPPAKENIVLGQQRLVALFSQPYAQTCRYRAKKGGNIAKSPFPLGSPIRIRTVPGPVPGSGSKDAAFLWLSRLVYSGL